MQKMKTPMKTKSRITYAKHRELTVQISVKRYWGTCPKTCSAGPLVQTWTAVPCVSALGSSVPDLGRLFFGLHWRPRDQSWYTKTNTLTQKRNQKGSSAETARLVLVPTETGKTQKQLSGDCSTSLGHTTQRKDNQPLIRHGWGGGERGSCSQ